MGFSRPALHAEMYLHSSGISVYIFWENAPCVKDFLVRVTKSVRESKWLWGKGVKGNCSDPRIVVWKIGIAPWVQFGALPQAETYLHVKV